MELTNEAKNAILNIFANAAWSVPNGQQYYDALADAFFGVAYISAVYTPSGEVTTSTPLDDLKTDLVVTATLKDSSTQTVPSTDYTLSGTLAVGTNTITVSYGGKTTTFSVTISGVSYVTAGLIHRWDAISNTANGHDSSTTTWYDLVGTSNLVMHDSTYCTWGDNYLQLAGDKNQYLDCEGGQLTEANAYTVEIVLQSSSTGDQKVLVVGAPQRSINYFNGNNISIDGKQGCKLYTTGLSALTDIRSISAVYDANVATGTAYCNGTAATDAGRTSSFQDYYDNVRIRLGATSSGTVSYPYEGKVYAIRIYNRQLTAAEIAQNYTADVQRFGL